MRWPASWKDDQADLLRGTAIEAVDPAAASPAVTLVKGVWPGVRSGRDSDASAGPTGVAWVDSNGWLARLTAARNAGSAVWIDAPPANLRRMRAAPYLIAMADSAAFGARWILSLDDALAAGIAKREAAAMTIWEHITAAARFFADRAQWSSWTPQAVVGVVSDFTAANEFFSQELLNLLDRADQHNRILRKDRLPADPFTSLRAVIYADQEPPTAALRKQVLGFVEGGGMLITTPVWGNTGGTDGRLGFSEKKAGKGVIAQTATPPDDPYVLANDSVILVSHRYDIVRCWNSGAFASHYTVAPAPNKAVVHLLFYADRGPDSATVRVTGGWRAAQISTVESPAPRPVKLAVQKGSPGMTPAVEVYLPQVSQYVALQLEG